MSPLILYSATSMLHVPQSHAPDLINIVVPVSRSRMAFGSAISWLFFVQISSKIVNFVFSSKMLNYICVKKMFGYTRCDSMTCVFLDLSLPTLDTVVHNSRVLFANQCLRSCNKIVQWFLQLWLYFSALEVSHFMHHTNLRLTYLLTYLLFNYTRVLDFPFISFIIYLSLCSYGPLSEINSD